MDGGPSRSKSAAGHRDTRQAPGGRLHSPRARAEEPRSGRASSPSAGARGSCEQETCGRGSRRQSLIRSFGHADRCQVLFNACPVLLEPYWKNQIPAESCILLIDKESGLSNPAESHHFPRQKQSDASNSYPGDVVEFLYLVAVTGKRAFAAWLYIENLSWIEDIVWIHHRLQRPHHLHRRRSDHFFQQWLLIEPHPMFSRDRSAEFDRGFLHLEHCPFRTAELLLVPFIGHVIGMKVPVAGVPEVPDHHVVLESDLADPGNELREVRAGYGDIFHDGGRLNPRQRGECGAARRFQSQGILCIASGCHGRRIVPPADFYYKGGILVDDAPAAVHFN